MRPFPILATTLSLLIGVVAPLFADVHGYFKWNNVVSCAVQQTPGCWPPGTTVELCFNGTCVTGLDGATQPSGQYETNVPIAPGERIDAKVRAVTPAGYQCGTPPVACPYSDWTPQYRLTLPANQTSMGAVKIGIPSPPIVAPTYVNQYATAFNSATSPKTAMNAVSINNKDVLILVAADENATGVLNFTENGASSIITQQSYTNSGYCETAIASYIATVNENITITFTDNGSPYFGGNVVRFSGSSGIGASAKAQGSTGNPSVALTTTQDNSAIVVIVSDWSAKSGIQTFMSTAGTPTKLTGFTGDNSHYGVAIGYYPNVGIAGNKTVGMSAPTGQTWSIIAIEVKGT